MMERISNSMRRFGRDEAGTATIEACLWMPVFVFFFLVVLDATYVLRSEGEVRRVVQDANREFVRGAYDSTNELEAWLEASLGGVAPRAEATVTVDGTGVLRTTVSYPASDAVITGIVPFLGLTIRVQAANQTEV